MAMVVKNNMSAVKTLNTLNKNSSALQKSLAKVSSGMKINSAQDDASGYAISERMRVQIRSLDQANQNTQNASSLMKTAEGAVSSTVEILKSLKEKAVNAATDTNTDQDRATIQKEIDQFIDQIDDNALTTFNGKYLVDGSKGQSGMAVATAMTNQSLGLYEVDGTTELTGKTELTNLTNRNGDSLEISSADYVTASFVKGGKTYTTKFRVGDESTGDITTLEGIFQKLNAIEGEDGNPVNAFGAGTASPPSGAAADPTQDPAVQAAKTELDNAKSTADSKLSAISTAITNATVTNGSSSNPTARDALVTIAKERLTSYFNSLSGTYNATTLSDMQSSSYYTDTTGLSASNYSSYGVSGTDWNAVKNNTGYTGSEHIRSHMTAMYSGSTSTNAMGRTINGSGVASAITAYNTAVADVTTKQTAYNNALAAARASASSGSSSSSSSDPVTLVTRSNQVGISTAGDAVYTADNDTGLTVTAATAGIEKQISGLTISITDSEGNVKKSANAALDAFNTTIYAKNKSESNELTFQVGAKANQSITVGLDDMRSEALGLKGSDGSKVSVATQDKANAAIAVFDNAIQKALDQQATIGAIEARLEYTSQNLTTSSENVQAAESTIRDADMAKEMTNYTKNNVLLQAAQSMLAQANQNSSAVLSLLQ